MSIKSKVSPIKLLAIILFVVFGALMLSPSTTTGISSVRLVGKVCGAAPNSVPTSIDLGCRGMGSPLVDLIFAIIRFLSTGVGIVVIGSIIVGGIQYIGSRGDPNATGHAIARIRSSIVALIIFIFGYAILNYVIPAGFFK